MTEKEAVALTEPLTVDLRSDDTDTVRLIVRGELDLGTASMFGERLREACENNPCQLLLDFTDLTFCDSSGIRACVRASNDCVEGAIEMRIIGAPPSVRRVFAIVGLTDHFDWLEN